MPRSRVERIRDCVRRRQYDLTAHAMEEMAEDSLDILDVECAILTGEITRTEKDDLRGTKYVVSGVATDRSTQVGVVGRFVSATRFVVITVYEVT